MNLSNLKYFIFEPRSGIVLDHDGVYAAAYTAWRAVWSDVFKEIGHNGDLSADEFIRHDLCCVLVDGSQIAGVHLYSYFDLTNSLQLQRRYLADNFDSFSLRAIEKSGCTRVMTMESLSVTPDYRRVKLGNVNAANGGRSVAELLIALGLKVFESEIQLDGVIACTRNSRKVNSMAEGLGFKTIARDRMAHGEVADLILFHRSDIRENAPLLERDISSLWNRRIELRRNLTTLNTSSGESNAA